MKKLRDLTHKRFPALGTGYTFSHAWHQNFPRRQFWLIQSTSTCGLICQQWIGSEYVGREQRKLLEKRNKHTLPWFSFVDCEITTPFTQHNRDIGSSDTPFPFVKSSTQCSFSISSPSRTKKWKPISLPCSHFLGKRMFGFISVDEVIWPMKEIRLLTFPAIDSLWRGATSRHVSARISYQPCWQNQTFVSIETNPLILV